MLLRLAATYLTRPNTGMGGIDPVARFHLGNGARLERVNWLGNVSDRGMRESYGVMVNYLYDPEAIEANHEVFVRSGQVARSAAVDALLTRPPRPGWPPAGWPGCRDCWAARKSRCRARPEGRDGFRPGAVWS